MFDSFALSGGWGMADFANGDLRFAIGEGNYKMLEEEGIEEK